MLPSSVSDPLIALVRAGSSSGLLAIADGLETGRITLESTSVGINRLHRVDDDLAARAYASFREIAGSLDEAAVAAALRTAVGIRDREHLDRPHVEVCWTGPASDGPLLVANAIAVRDLLRECNDTGNILLVGYSFTVPEGAFMEEVIELLVDASKRHARIQVILHQDEEAKNKAELLKNWDVFARKPEIYTWDPPKDILYTKLHAKCLVVDRLQMLVTSANFTYLGMESNIELGLLVRNQPLATTVHDQFDHLISEGVLRKWEDAA